MKDKYLQLNAEQFVDSTVYGINKYLKQNRDRLADDITMVFRNNQRYTKSKPHNSHIIETSVEFGYKEIKLFEEEQAKLKKDYIVEIIEILKDQIKIGIAKEYVKDIKKYLNTDYKVKYWRNPASVLFECKKNKRGTNIGIKFYFSVEIGTEIYM